jgi:chromosomal replication initiator protein
MPAFALDPWVRPLVVEARDGRLRLHCPSQFHRERLRQRLLPKIAECARAEAGHPVEIELAVAEVAAPAEAIRTPAADAAGARPAASGRAAAPPATRPPASPAPTGPATQRTFAYTFDSFVVGSCNALAREAAYAVASGQQRELGLLYLRSDTGLGKTHLARAIVEEARRHGHCRTIYASAETFTSDFMQAIRTKQMDAFKRRYRDGCDLLVVEDVPFLAAKRATQLELFHTLEHLLDAGARVVFTGSRLPRDVPGFDPRFGSQVTAGLVAELERPDARVRRQILRSKSAAGGVKLPDDCLDLLVDRVRGNVRDLEGVLIQLVSSAALLKRTIDLDLTRAALRKVADGAPPERHLRCRDVTEAVAAFFKTTPQALASRSRRRDVLVPRQLAMYLCGRYTDEPAAVIGQAFGRRHTAVANAEKVVARAILERAPLRYQVEALCERLDQLEAEMRQRAAGPGSGRARRPRGRR